jgi:hypothetical protein
MLAYEVGLRLKSEFTVNGTERLDLDDETGLPAVIAGAQVFVPQRRSMSIAR